MQVRLSHFRRLLSIVLACWFFSASAILLLPKMAIADSLPRLDSSLSEQVIEAVTKNSKMREFVEVIVQQAQVGRFPLRDIETQFKTAWESTAQVISDPHVSSGLAQVLHNKQLIKDADRFLKQSPAHLCNAYRDSLQNVDNSTWEALEAGARSAMTLTSSIAAASASGAGSLAGYAGLASAVSDLGLGGVVTLIAGLLGSSTTGAAATAVVTSAVGGPIAMSTLLVGGTGVIALGTYEAGHTTFKKLGEWAELYCNSQF